MANEPITDEELLAWAKAHENRWQIITWSANGNSYLSTVELPKFSGFLNNYHYESCLFHDNGHSDVVAEYETKEEAIQGHLKLLKELNIEDGNTVEYDNEDRA